VPDDPGEKVAYIAKARLEGVEVDAGASPANSSYLYVDSADPLIPKFYVRLEASVPRGSLELAIPQLHRTITIAVTDIKLGRLAQLPNRWARKDFIANTLELDLSARTLPCGDKPDAAAGAAVRVSGELFNYWDRPYDGSWNLVVDLEHLGETVRSCVLANAGGADVTGRIALTGPFVAKPKLDISVENLDYLAPMQKDGPLLLTLVQADGSIDLVDLQGTVDKATAAIHSAPVGQRQADTIVPGEIAVTASFSLQPPNGRAHVDIAKPVDLLRFLPPTARPAGHLLQGRFQIIADAETGFTLKDVELSLGHTKTERMIRVGGGTISTDRDFHVVTVEHLDLVAGRSHGKVDGTIDLAGNMLDLTLSDGRFPDLGDWLQRFQLPAFAQSAGTE
jgi:hypothetical protein